MQCCLCITIGIRITPVTFLYSSYSLLPLPIQKKKLVHHLPFPSSLVFLNFNTAKTTSGAHWTPPAGTEVDGEGKITSFHLGRIPIRIHKIFPCPGIMWQCLQTPWSEQFYFHIDSMWKLLLIAQINRKHHLWCAVLRNVHMIPIYSHFYMIWCCFSPKCFNKLFHL